MTYLNAVAYRNRSFLEEVKNKVGGIIDLIVFELDEDFEVKKQSEDLISRGGLINKLVNIQESKCYISNFVKEDWTHIAIQEKDKVECLEELIKLIKENELELCIKVIYPSGKCRYILDFGFGKWDVIEQEGSRPKKLEVV